VGENYGIKASVLRGGWRGGYITSWIIKELNISDIICIFGFPYLSQVQRSNDCSSNCHVKNKVKRMGSRTHITLRSKYFVTETVVM
jgi:hypothetical protein